MNIEFLRKNRECRISRDISKRIFCSPIYLKLTYEEIKKIIEIMKGVYK